MTKKNVLVISEQFTKGGLEIHILNQVVGLKDDVNFIFAFGKYEENEKLKNNKIYNIGSFSSEYTVSKFYEQVKTLLDIVEKEKIDVIHAHPFMSLLPAMFTSVISGKPMIYTLHGGPSLSMYSDVFTYSFLQRFFFNYLDQEVIAVRKGFESAVESRGAKKIHYIPNSLIIKDYNGIKRVENNRWALLSRLDDESQTAIFDIIDKIDDIGIGSIDIFGVGWAESIIRDHIEEKELLGRVKLRGWSDGVMGALMNKEYEGIIGHGQTALDGLAAGLPVLLLSYGRVTGLIDGDLYSEVKDYNFVNIFQRSVSNKEIIHQFNQYHRKPDDYILADQVRRDFDNKKAQKQYLSIIKGAKHKYSTQLVDMWERVTNLVEDKSPTVTEQFLESTAIEQIIEECTLRYGFVMSPNLLDIINENKQYRKISRTIDQLRFDVDELINRVNDQKIELEKLYSIKKSSKLLAGNIKRRITRRSK